MNSQKMDVYRGVGGVLTGLDMVCWQLSRDETGACLLYGGLVASEIMGNGPLPLGVGCVVFCVCFLLW